MSTKQDVTKQKQRWPAGAIVYHIYPRSLQDSNGDGIGDLPGIIERLDYLRSLSVDTIWLPMADFGYDIADYCNVDKIFGNLDDFKELLAACADRSIKVLVDLVPNHTSDDHAWFRASRQSMANGYSDWYIWRNGQFDADGQHRPPNNWLDALTGRSAWQWDGKRQQYYLHSFDVRQPDLNWTNQAVRDAMKNVMRFWLNLGVDGFRVDAVYWMAKDPLQRDDPPSEDYVEGQDPPYESLKHNNSRGWPAVYSHLNELAGVLKEEQYADKPRFMVTEAYPEGHNPVADYMAFYEGVDPRVAAPFNFEGVSLPWEARAWQRFLTSFHAALLAESPACVASYAFGNHDQPRLASRIGVDAARAAAVMLMTLPGMAFVYYGEELGMQDVPIPAGRVQDPAAIGDPAKGQGRDPARTPMQWTAASNAGFTTAAEPWLPLAADYTECNVETQSADATSSLSLYRRLGELRRRSAALRHSPIEVLDSPQTQVLLYKRSYGDEALLVAVNFGEQPVDVELADTLKERLASSAAAPNDVPGDATDLRLQSHEAAVFRL
jgi:alpha-glucosidase